MGDHYKVLGVSKSATKDEIKTAFRKLAVQFHPDKHTQSPKPTRDAASLKFQQLSAAYEVLVDDRKRAAYNISQHHVSNTHTHTYNTTHNTCKNYSNNNYHYYYNNNNGYYYYTRSYGDTDYSYRRPPRASSGGFRASSEAAFRSLNTRSALLHLAFAGLFFGSIVAIDRSGEALWKTQNHGKSFEELLKSLEDRNDQKSFEEIMKSIKERHERKK